jgi:(hydroxyamino)benzene mutase
VILSSTFHSATAHTDWSLRQGHRLLQLGVLLFFFALLVGLVVPMFAVPRLGLSTHLLGLMQGLFLVVLGLLWPKLRLTRMLGGWGVVLAVYGCFAAWTANLSAAIWGAGNTMLPIAAGASHGTALQEAIVSVALRSAAVSLIAAAGLVLWGLRTSIGEESVR